MNLPRLNGPFVLVCFQFLWISRGVSAESDAENTSYVGDKYTSSAELVLDCNALQSAAGYGLTWLSTKVDFPPNSTVNYSGVGTDEDDNGGLSCSFRSQDLCGWSITGDNSSWAVTSSLDHYLGPILDYRWEGIQTILTDGSETMLGPMYVSSGTVAISVRAMRDAYVKLSLGEDPITSPTYWILFGGWKNTLSVVRSCPKGIPARKGEPSIEGCLHRKEQNEEENVLSPWQWKTFIISITPDGTVLVNRTDGSKLLRWKDPKSIFSGEGQNNSFYLNFRTHDVSGQWKIHRTSFLLISANASSGEVVRIFSPYFKLNRSTLCVTILHYMTSRKNIPGIGFMVDKKAYINMIAQPIGKDQGWTLIKYTGKVNKTFLGGMANFVISVNRNQISSVAIGDFRMCPKAGVRRRAQLRVLRNEIRQNESFVCLPLPYPKGMFVECPNIRLETINGVCVSVMNSTNPFCKCKLPAESCEPPCSTTSNNSSASVSCQPDPKTCLNSHFGFTGEEKTAEVEITQWSPTETTPQWTTITEPIATATENIEPTQEVQVFVKNLKVTSRSFNWLKIRWLSPHSTNQSAFVITWWKTKFNETGEERQEEKWEQVLKVGPLTMCPNEWEDYYCGTIWNLESNQNYTILVRLQDRANDSLDTSEAFVVAETLHVPWGPSHVYVANRTESNVTLIWKAKLPPVYVEPNTFSIYYRQSHVPFNSQQWMVTSILADEESNEYKVMIGNLSPASLYEFCIHLNKHGTDESKDAKEYGKIMLGYNLMRENLTSACTYTRTLPKKPFIPERTLLFQNCTHDNGFLNVTLVLNFTAKDEGVTPDKRAYFICVTNHKSKSRLSDWHIKEELLKELDVKDIHVAAELKWDLRGEIHYILGDGATTEGSYGNFINTPINSTKTKTDVILVAVAEEHGDRRYTWQKASYPANCNSMVATLLFATLGGLVSLLILGATGWILFRNRHRIREIISSSLEKINTLCQRNDDDNEWRRVQKKGNNSIHLETIPIEPDDQVDYSDSDHDSSQA